MKFYNSIKNLPIEIWDQIHTDGDLSLLYYGFGKKLIVKLFSKKIENNWSKIYDEYIKEFGLSEEYEEIMRLKIALANAQLKYITTGSRLHMNDVILYQTQLDSKKQGESAKIRDVIFNIEKALGFKLNGLTVYEFYNYLDNLKKQSAHGEENKA